MVPSEPPAQIVRHLAVAVAAPLHRRDRHHANHHLDRARPRQRRRQIPRPCNCRNSQATGQARHPDLHHLEQKPSAMPGALQNGAHQHEHGNGRQDELVEARIEAVKRAKAVGAEFGKARGPRDDGASENAIGMPVNTSRTARETSVRRWSLDQASSLNGLVTLAKEIRSPWTSSCRVSAISPMARIAKNGHITGAQGLTVSTSEVAQARQARSTANFDNAANIGMSRKMKTRPSSQRRTAIGNLLGEEINPHMGIFMQRIGGAQDKQCSGAHVGEYRKPRLSARRRHSAPSPRKIMEMTRPPSRSGRSKTADGKMRR